jgi:hypothetical protein
LPVGDLLAIGVLGDLELALSDVLERVVGGGAFAALA